MFEEVCTTTLSWDAILIMWGTLGPHPIDPKVATCSLQELCALLRVRELTAMTDIYICLPLGRGDSERAKASVEAFRVEMRARFREVPLVNILDHAEILQFKGPILAEDGIYPSWTIRQQVGCILRECIMGELQ